MGFKGQVHTNKYAKLHSGIKLSPDRFTKGYERDLYFCYGESVGEGDPTRCIWEAEASIKKDKLYLTIVEDNFTKMEGTVIVLEQEKTNQK